MVHFFPIDRPPPIILYQPRVQAFFQQMNSNQVLNMTTKQDHTEKTSPKAK